VAAKAIRQILLNEARRRRAEKRGGEAPILSLEELRAAMGGAAMGGAAARAETDRSARAEGDVEADRKITTEEEAELLVLLDEALGRFAEEYPRAARGVECRFFGGMTVEETAEALGVSSSTVSRDWNLAQAWLYREMKRLRGEETGSERDG
jgi:RNA polymerase sigma factor (sigma-70 family)